MSIAVMGQSSWSKGKKLGKYSKDRCTNISKALTGRHLSTSHKKSISNGLQGKKREPLSDKTKKRISVTLRYLYKTKQIVSLCKGKKRTKEVKLKISKKRKNKCMGDDNPSKRLEVRKKISKKLKNRIFSKEWINKIKIARQKQKIPFKDTTIEIKMQNILKENDIEFEKHKPILGQPDIFIEPNICIFCDGCYWHSCPTHFPNSKYSFRIERDKSINKQLKKQSYQVLRFWEHEINSNIEKCLKQIKKYLNC